MWRCRTPISENSRVLRMKRQCPAGVGLAKSALFVVTYIDFLVDGDPGKGLDDLVRYGSDTSRAPGQLSYTVLQQLDRPNRFATLEVWDSVTDSNNWQNDPKSNPSHTELDTRTE